MGKVSDPADRIPDINTFDENQEPLPVMTDINHKPGGGAEPTFEQALTSLEGIVHQLEDGNLGLADALSRYEQGVSCLRLCYRLLEQAERKIELLVGADAQGKAVTEPFDQEASFSADGETGRPARRRKPANPPRRPEGTGETDATGMDEAGRLF